MPLHKYYYIISPLYAKLELQQNRPHYLNIASINPTHPLGNSGLEMHQLTTALTPHVSLYLGADNWEKMKNACSAVRADDGNLLLLGCFVTRFFVSLHVWCIRGVAFPTRP